MASQRSANCTSWGLKNGQRSAVRSRQQQEAVSGQQSAVRDQRLAARGQRSVRSPPVAASSRKVGDLRHASRSPVTAAAVHTAPACRPPIRDAGSGQLSSSRSAVGRQQSAGQAGGVTSSDTRSGVSLVFRLRQTAGVITVLTVCAGGASEPQVFSFPQPSPRLVERARATAAAQLWRSVRFCARLSQAAGPYRARSAPVATAAFARARGRFYTTRLRAGVGLWG